MGHRLYYGPATCQRLGRQLKPEGLRLSHICISGGCVKMPKELNFMAVLPRFDT